MADETNVNESGESACSGAGSRLFQIYEQDLAELEQSLPVLSDAVGPLNERRIKVHLRRLKRIVSDIRWNYGPHDDVTIVEA